MLKLRSIAVVLVALAFAGPLCAAAYAEPLEADECKELKDQKQALLTATVNAALTRGPDWVKENIYDLETIERVRKYLQVEANVAFRCRTDGVRIPEPEPPSLPDRKPTVPTFALAGMAAAPLIPLRNPSRDKIEATLAAQEAAGEGDTDEPDIAGLDEDMSTEADSAAGASQAMAGSDKTAVSDSKATQ